MRPVTWREMLALASQRVLGRVSCRACDDCPPRQKGRKSFMTRSSSWARSLLTLRPAVALTTAGATFLVGLLLPRVLPLLLTRPPLSLFRWPPGRSAAHLPPDSTKKRMLLLYYSAQHSVMAASRVRFAKRSDKPLTRKLPSFRTTGLGIRAVGEKSNEAIHSKPWVIGRRTSLCRARRQGDSYGFAN
jgi:hypothetical protein